MEIKKYSTNFLEEVIFQIKYSPILELKTDDVDVASKFQKIISKEFPNLYITHNKTVKFRINAYTGKSLNDGDPENFAIWEFSNGNKTVKLSGDEVILSYRRGEYSSFGELCQDVNLIINALKEYMDPKIRFMGLRYINKIDCFDKEDNLKEYINPNLTVNNIFNETILQSLCRLEFRLDKYFLAFQYGQFNPEYPNPNGEKEFVLDYDCVLHSVELGNILTDLKAMNEIIYDKFEKSIEDKLREHMRG